MYRQSVHTSKREGEYKVSKIWNDFTHKYNLNLSSVLWTNEHCLSFPVREEKQFLKAMSYTYVRADKVFFSGAFACYAVLCFVCTNLPSQSLCGLAAYSSV